MASRVRIRRDLASVWASANPVLAAAELGYETDTGKIKAGDGITLWNELDYIDDAAKAFTTSSLAAHAIDAGAHPNYVHISSLADVAFSGSFSDLIDSPVISAALDELTDVEITSPSDGQAIVYDATSGKWVNETVASTGGEVGAFWLQGSGAPAAGLGSNGDFYLDTETGDIYGPLTDGNWGPVIFNIAEGQQGPVGPTGATGATGPAGADGRTLLNGTSAPSNSVGANGDFFIDTAASIIYGPKAAGVWPAGVSLIGPTGATGPQGPAGPAGPEGPQGPAGSDATATPLSDATPQAPGTAAAGTASTASRSDHVHPLPPLVSSTTAGLQPASGYGTITYAAQVTLDFSTRDRQINTISLTGNLELLTSNLANGREVRLRLVCDSSQRTLTFPTDWKFVGTKPANIAASKVAILSLAAFGTTNADVVAAYAVQS